MMQLDKQSLRVLMKKKRLDIGEKTFFLHSQSILQKVLHHPRYLNSQIIGIYVSINHEVDTFSLIQEALKTHIVCVPKVQGENMEFYVIHSLDDLKAGAFHILEPMTKEKISPSQIDLMIVPMLGFDITLHRVGYGRGYYDRYFSRGFKGYKLGLAFSFQQVDFITSDSYDIALDEVLTE